MNSITRYTNDKTAIAAAINKSFYPAPLFSPPDKPVKIFKSVLYNKDNVPKELPAVIVSVLSEQPSSKSRSRYNDSSLSWEIFVVVNAHGVSDPDADLLLAKETLREAIIGELGRDFDEVDYYSSRADGSRQVRVARCTIGVAE